MDNVTRGYRFVGNCDECEREVWTEIETTKNAMNGDSKDQWAFCLNCGDPVPVYPVANGEAAEQLGIKRLGNGPDLEEVSDD